MHTLSRVLQDASGIHKAGISTRPGSGGVHPQEFARKPLCPRGAVSSVDTNYPGRSERVVVYFYSPNTTGSISNLVGSVEAEIPRGDIIAHPALNSELGSLPSGKEGVQPT